MVFIEKIFAVCKCGNEMAYHDLYSNILKRKEEKNGE